MKIAFMVTVPLTAWAFMRGQLRFFRDAGHEVCLMARDEPLLEGVAKDEGVSWQGLPLQREISLGADLRALWATWRAFRSFRPDLTAVGTPKAGLIGGLAAVLAGVPARVYVLHGIRGERAVGAKGMLFRLIERIACACAHKVVCVSPSVRERAIELGFMAERKAVVLGQGSANGVEMERFSVVPAPAALAELRRQVGLPERCRVIGFVGRFTRDKGIDELVSAFSLIERDRPDVRLLMLGDFDETDPVAPETRDRIRKGGSIIWPGAVADPAPYYPLLNILVLPTYREGFPTVCLEGAAAGLPIVATWATGARDAVIDGVTGRLVPIGDASALATAIGELLDDPERALAFGIAGQERVRREFQPQRIWTSMNDLFLDLFPATGRLPTQ